MIQIQNQIHFPKPLEIDDGELIDTVEQLVDAVISASEKHAESLELPDAGESVEFKIACDALNSWRGLWRLREEFGVDVE